MLAGPIRKAFTFHADPRIAGQPYVAIADEENTERGIYLGIQARNNAHEILIERSDVDSAALKSRWAAVSNLRVNTIANLAIPQLMLRDGLTPVARINIQDNNPESLARTYTTLVDETARYLKQTVSESTFDFPYFDPTFHYDVSDLRESQFWLRMKFFDGTTRGILLETGIKKYGEADAKWGPSMDAYTLQLEDHSGDLRDQRVVIYDTKRKPVRFIPYDSASPDGHRASQVKVMAALRETYISFRRSLTL